MARHLLLTVRLHGDGRGVARFHGMVQGNPEWPPSPARVFQALVAGNAQGEGLTREVWDALEWMERLPPPAIAAPRAQRGSRATLYVPNNDADAQPDPRDVSSIRVKKVVHPALFDAETPLIYAWPVPEESPHADVVIRAALGVYQLGRGVDMAWAVGELVDDEELERRLTAHGGTIHLPEPSRAGRAVACSMPGSLVSLERRHRATRFVEDAGSRTPRLLFANAPKPRFQSIAYERAGSRGVWELRDRADEAKAWAWPLHRVVSLVERVRDGAAARLRKGLPDEHAAIEGTLVGRKANGSDPSPTSERARLVPLPSIGHAHADHGVRRILLEIPSGASLRAADVEWSLSGLEPPDPLSGRASPFVLTRAEGDRMLEHYLGPARRWRSVTPLALPETARRRRIDPARRHEEPKPGSERAAEEARAAGAVQVALRHAGVHATVVAARVQREPFEPRGTRVELFADGTRFAKERLWHVDLELDRSVEGPLVLGDGRFLGLGVMAPVAEAWTGARAGDPASARSRLQVGDASAVLGLFALNVASGAKDEPLVLARALRRAVIARVQAQVRDSSLGRFFTGHEEDGTLARAPRSNHLAFQWDATRRRLLVIAPHWLDHRGPTVEERREIGLLTDALEGLVELRAGTAGRFAVNLEPLDAADPLLASSRSWASATPYAVTRHKKRSTASEVLIEDVVVECQRRGLPRATTTVLDARGLAGRGLEGRIRLDFTVAVYGPLVLGRTRYLGGGLFGPVNSTHAGLLASPAAEPRPG